LGILEWIEDKAREKMRFAHIKILYQNIFAVAFLIEKLEKAAALPTGAETLENLLEIQARTRVLADELPDDDMLKDASSELLFADNRTLKKTYAAVEAEPTGSKEAIDFVARFQPAAGWKAFSDADWAEVVSGSSKA